MWKHGSLALQKLWIAAIVTASDSDLWKSAHFKRAVFPSPGIADPGWKVSRPKPLGEACAIFRNRFQHLFNLKILKFHMFHWKHACCFTSPFAKEDLSCNTGWVFAERPNCFNYMFIARGLEKSKLSSTFSFPMPCPRWKQANASSKKKGGASRLCFVVVKALAQNDFKDWKLLQRQFRKQTGICHTS